MTRSIYSRSRIMKPVRDRQYRTWVRAEPAVCGGTESFTGTDGLLGATTTDLEWTQYSQVGGDFAWWEVASNELAMTWNAETTFPNDAARARCEQPSCTTSQFMEFDWLTIPAAPDPEGFVYLIAALRLGNDYDWYVGGNGVWFELFWYGTTAGGLDIDGFVYADAGTDPLAYEHIDDASPVGSTFRFEVEGDTVRVLRDSVLIYTQTSAYLTAEDPSGLYAGIGGYPSGTQDPGAAATFDNIDFGDL